MIPYPGSDAKWHCKCLRCGSEVFPRFQHVKRGHGGCLNCSNNAGAAKRLKDLGNAEAYMLESGIQPLEPYPGVSKPWLSRCLRCKKEVSPRLTNVLRGHDGCRYCAHLVSSGKRKSKPSEALADMEAAGYTPLEDYPGVMHPWRCIHNSCGKEVIRKLNKIRSGEIGCAFCAIYGFNFSDPATIYVLHHPESKVVKVGIRGSGSNRVDKFQRRGFVVIGELSAATGQQARDVEQAVLRYVRVRLGLKNAMTEADLWGIGGWTEIFGDSELSPEELWALVRQFAGVDCQTPVQQ